MIAETGHYALILALGVAIVQTLLPLLGARLRDPQLAAVAAPAARMQFVSALLLSLAICLLLPSSAQAVQPDEVLPDPALEARARAISEGLRCLVCQNQSIDDSDAPLAKDLRLLVRERLKAGDSDQEIVDFVVARYGEFVLLKPRLSQHTLLLWLATPAVFAAALGLIWLAYRRRREAAQAQAPLSANEERRLKRLLDER
jgi:cytochrome c-type biogenesis protein CcmH